LIDDVIQSCLTPLIFSQARPVSESHALAVIEAVGAHLYRLVFSEGTRRLLEQVEDLARLASGLLMAEIPAAGAKSSRPKSRADAANA
jgi:hypothetical protein